MHSALTTYFNPPHEIVGSTKVLGKRVADELDLRPGTSTSFTPPPRLDTYSLPALPGLQCQPRRPRRGITTLCPKKSPSSLSPANRLRWLICNVNAASRVDLFEMFGTVSSTFPPDEPMTNTGEDVEPQEVRAVSPVKKEEESATEDEDEPDLKEPAGAARTAERALLAFEETWKGQGTDEEVTSGEVSSLSDRSVVHQLTRSFALSFLCPLLPVSHRRGF